MHSRHRTEEAVGNQSASLSLQPLNISQNVVTGLSETNSAEETRTPILRLSRSPHSRKVTCQNSKLPSTASGSKVASTSRKNLKSGLECPGSSRSEPDDLYDFVFSVPTMGEEKALDICNRSKESAKGKPSDLDAAPLLEELASMEERSIGVPSLESAHHFRSVRALNLHNIPLTVSSCRILCHLLCSWVSLERLTMAYNDLGANIFHVVEALSALSRCPGCCLGVLSMSDFTAYVPTLNLAHTILTTFPSLQLLSLSYDLENHTEKEKSEENLAEFTDHRLKQLDIRFPQDPLRAEHLISVLKASASLSELSLDNATFSCQEDLRCVLRTLAEYNPALRRLSFHDMKLTDTHNEIVLLLKNCSLEGNEGLVALADLYSPDSLSSIHYLDVSSNCIKPDGLLQFARKLEGCGKIKLRHLSLSQNLLDRDPMMAQEALHSLEGVCCVVSDTWASAQAFAEHVSVM
ncbi:hypothetical protein FKM82_002030 [Ascaphus truei]